MKEVSYTLTREQATEIYLNGFAAALRAQEMILEKEDREIYMREEVQDMVDEGMKALVMFAEMSKRGLMSSGLEDFLNGLESE